MSPFVNVLGLFHFNVCVCDRFGDFLGIEGDLEKARDAKYVICLNAM